MKKLVLLDRDGTICQDNDYLDDWRKMRIFDYSYDALKIIKKKGYHIYIVTNQSGVARGKFSLEEAENQKKFVLSFFNREEKIIEEYLYCPHHKDGVVKELSFDCDCRKPKTGLIDRVLKLAEVDNHNSYMVGDKLIDIELAINLKIVPVLVLTGYGRDDLKKLKDREGHEVLIYNDILDFAKNLKESKMD